jgi:hypothetical protein
MLIETLAKLGKWEDLKNLCFTGLHEGGKVVRHFHEKPLRPEELVSVVECAVSQSIKYKAGKEEVNQGMSPRNSLNNSFAIGSSDDYIPSDFQLQTGI